MMRRVLLVGAATVGAAALIIPVVSTAAEPVVPTCVEVAAGDGWYAVARAFAPGWWAQASQAEKDAFTQIVIHGAGKRDVTALPFPNEIVCINRDRVPQITPTSTSTTTTTVRPTTTTGVTTSTSSTTTTLAEPTTTGTAATTTTVAPTTSGGFLETFDGLPTNPAPWNPTNWDVFQTSRDRYSWENPDPMSAHHAMANCGDVAAGGAHEVTTWAQTVFLCNNHVMTSIDGTPGYAAVYLSPPAMLDFSSGPSTLGFDVSTFVSSNRDWIDVTITAPGDVMSYPFRSDLGVDGSGPPANSLHVEQTFGSESWIIEITRNGVATRLGELRIPYAQFGGQSRVVRTPVQIVVGRTSLTLSYPTVPGSSVTVNFPALSWSRGVVQFGHHSYTPYKDCTASSGPDCGPDTWHWDNIAIAPSLPFYQRQATPERTGAPIYDSGVRQIIFAEPAPAGAQLMFGGECGVQVREIGTTAWRAATIIGPNDHPEHTQSYAVNVAAGSTGVDYRFVANDWYTLGYGCQVQNPIIKVLN